MKKILFTLFNFLLIVSCTKEDHNEDIQTNKALIKSIKYSDDGGTTYSELTYDITGRLEKKIDTENNLIYQNFYLNTNSALFDRTEYYNSDSSINAILYYEYDEQNRLIKRTHIENDIITTETIYERDENENTIKISFLKNENYIKNYLDQFGNIINIEYHSVTNGDDSISNVITPSYDSNGNITEIISKTEDTNNKYTFTYDRKENPFQILASNLENSNSIIDNKLIPLGIGSGDLITFMPPNNFIECQRNNSLELSRDIEYNENNYPIKISYLETTISISSPRNRIMLINYF